MTGNNSPNTDLTSGAEQDYGQFTDDVIERPLVRTKTRGLNRWGSMDPGLLSWLEELYPYEERFLKYDEHGRVLLATLEEILQTVAQWYVRKNNKHYDVDVPGEVLARDDVERIIIHRLKLAFPGNNIPQDVVRQHTANAHQRYLRESARKYSYLVWH